MNRNGSLSRVGYSLLLLLCFLVPLGELTKLNVSALSGGGIAMLGPTTVLALSIIAIGVLSGQMFKVLGRNRLLFLPYIYAAVAIFASFLLSDFMATYGIYHGLFLVLYYSVALSVVSLMSSRSQVLVVLLVLMFSGTLMTALAVIDHHGIVDIPRVNERSFSIEAEDQGVRVKTLSGPFRSRSEYAAHICLILPISFVFALSKGCGIVFRSTAFACFLVMFYGVLIAGSRGLYLALMVFVPYVVLFIAPSRRVVNLFLAAVLFCSLIFLFSVFKPETFIAIASRFSSLSFDSIRYVDYDMIRIHAFTQTLSELLYRPWGVGITQVYIWGRYWDAHNVFTEFLRGAGVIGLLLGYFFFFPLVKRALRPRDIQVEVLLVASFLSFLAYNMAHSFWQTNVLWVCFGLYVAVISNPERPSISGKTLF